MKKIAHISDLHFGTEENSVAEGLVRDLQLAEPDIVVVSGDLTQRARRKQFVAARNYLDRLPTPQLIVPGNHDIPLFDIVRRFFAPLNRYHEIITNNTSPVFRDTGLAIYGINTARSNTWKEGRISHDQMQQLEMESQKTPDNAFQIVVTHHPVIPPPDEPGVTLVGRAESAVDVIDRCGIDLILSGHLHEGYSGDVRTYYPATGRSIVVAQAGTAISRRRREEPNGYNLLTVGIDRIHIEVRKWQDGRFSPALTSEYHRDDRSWRPAGLKS